MGHRQQNTNRGLIDKLKSYFVQKPERFGAVIFRTTDQTINNNTTTAINFNENNNWPRSYDRALTYTSSAPWVARGGPYPFWAVANPERLTVPAPAAYEMGNLAGEYLITGHIDWEISAVGDRQIGLRVVRPPAASVRVALERWPAATLATRMSASRKLWLNPGDYVYMDVHQTSGGVLDVVSNTEFSPILTICMLR